MITVKNVDSGELFSVRKLTEEQEKLVLKVLGEPADGVVCPVIMVPAQAKERQVENTIPGLQYTIVS